MNAEGVLTGLDVLVRERFVRFRGRRIGLLCNQASVARNYYHSLGLFAEADAAGLLSVGAVFGPQHGLWGHTQDNMIEWEGFHDARTGFPVHSLYGKRRKPVPEMLEGLDEFVVDLPDAGARPYTFLWTMLLCIEACAEAGIPVTVLDRPNPIGGLRAQGPVLDPGYASFIGLRPLPMVHGMTMGEMARHFAGDAVNVVRTEGWRRGVWMDDTDLPWVAPSPNLPSVATAAVYPGVCLLEGTNLSEGRGTTQPFETFGAPFLDGWEMCRKLNTLELPGCRFRMVVFQPTFDKHAGNLCQGGFLHITDRNAFEPVVTGVAILREAYRMAGDAFQWRQPPFEYDTQHLPIDILAGNAWVRQAVEENWTLNAVRERCAAEACAFEPQRSAALLYS